MITRLLVITLLAGSPDAGELPDAGAPLLTLESLYTACPDAPFAEAVDGGYFVPEQRARRQVCQQAACEKYAETKLLEDSGPAHPGTVLMLAGGGVVVLVAGILIGFFIPRPTK